jgi:hypothetical protein
MKVYKLNLEQKKQLELVEFIEDNFYSPTEDAEGNFFISSEEVNQTTNENYLWVKDLPQIEHKPIEKNEK